MKITIKTEGQNRRYTERIGFEYQVGQQIDVEVRGHIKHLSNAYEIIEDGRTVSSDKNGQAYIPLCNGVDQNGKEYGIFITGRTNVALVAFES